MRLSTWIIIIFVIAALAILKFGFELSKSIQVRLPSTYSLPGDYDSLVSDRFKDRSSIEEVINNKRRNPIAVCYYDSSYLVMIHKLSLKASENPLGTINLSTTNADMDKWEMYSVLKKALLSVYIKSIPEERRNNGKIVLNIYSDSLRVISSRNKIIYYATSLKHCSLKYSDEEDMDFFITNQDRSLFRKERIDVIIAFIENNLASYFIAIIPQKNDVDLRPNIIDSLFKAPIN